MIKNKRYAVSFEVLTYRNGDLHSNKQEFTTMTGEVNTDKQLLPVLPISSKKEQKKFSNLLAVACYWWRVCHTRTQAWQHLEHK